MSGPSMQRFRGKIAVVTGAGSGIGLAVAAKLAGEGARVVVVDIDGDAARAACDSLPSGSLAVTADVSAESDVDAYIAAAVARFGRIDLHHLNAGVFGSFADLPDLTADEFDRVMAVNTRGQFLGLRAAFRQFRTQGTGGAIVLTGSIAGLTGSADLLAYQTSKHATNGLVRGAAMYGGPLGIRVNGVAPGLVPTNLFRSSDGNIGSGSDMAARGRTTPLRRVGSPAEIAAVTAFLLSGESSYMTGQMVSADGGAAMTNTVRPSGGAGAWDASAYDRSLYRHDSA